MTRANSPAEAEAGTTARTIEPLGRAPALRARARAHQARSRDPAGARPADERRGVEIDDGSRRARVPCRARTREQQAAAYGLDARGGADWVREPSQWRTAPYPLAQSPAASGLAARGSSPRHPHARRGMHGLTTRPGSLAG